MSHVKFPNIIVKCSVKGSYPGADPRCSLGDHGKILSWPTQKFPSILALSDAPVWLITSPMRPTHQTHTFTTTFFFFFFFLFSFLVSAPTYSNRERPRSHWGAPNLYFSTKLIKFLSLVSYLLSICPKGKDIFETLIFQCHT